MARLNTVQAARRLGVKPSTIYAYVSRGVLTSTPSKDGRQSTFSSAEVEMLARRGRPRLASRSRALDFTIDTAITSITQHQLSYRGHDVTSLSRSATFEQVAGLLLTGSLAEHRSWPVREIEGVIPADLDVFDHIGLVTILAAASDALRNDLSPGSVTQIASALISSVVESWPTRAERGTPRLTIDDATYRSTIAARLWTRMSDRRPRRGMVELLNAALVLLADHELAVSTVAARVTASTRSDPYAVISAGVAAIQGPLHGGVSRPARRMLEQALLRQSAPDSLRVGAERAAGEALQLHGMYPGFGHKVYKFGDPRAEALLAMLRTFSAGSREMETVDALIAAIHKRSDVRPNIDLALAAFGMVAGLPEDSGQMIFSLARIAGWSAHAIEEYAESPLRFRARAVYIG